MGLDLMMYNKREYMEYNKITELAYGRKTWAIESYFASRSYPIISKEYVFDVPEEAWDEFYTTAINLGFEKFKIWVDVIYEYERIGEHVPEVFPFSDVLFAYLCRYFLRRFDSAEVVDERLGVSLV